mgnify:CR=1 FL=1
MLESSIVPREKDVYKMGDRCIPEGNPILVEKERKRLRQVHLSRLRKTKSSLDTSLPRGFSKKKGGGLTRKKNLKLEQQMEERYTAIEHENRRLLEKMSQTVTSKTLDNKLEAKYRHFSTVNGPARARRQKDIKLDNANNKRRLTSTEAFYQTKVWEKEREEQEKRIIYFCKITAGRKGRVVAPLIKRRPKKKKKRKEGARPKTVAVAGTRGSGVLLEPIGRSRARPNTTGRRLHGGPVTKEEIEEKLSQVQKRLEHWGKEASIDLPITQKHAEVNNAVGGFITLGEMYKQPEEPHDRPKSTEEILVVNNGVDIDIEKTADSTPQNAPVEVGTEANVSELKTTEGAKEIPASATNAAEAAVDGADNDTSVTTTSAPEGPPAE